MRPYGVRVIDGALSGCPAGAVPLVAVRERVSTPLRGGDRPRLIAAKQTALIAKYAPRVVLWHSITEIWGILDRKHSVPPGSEEWRRRVMASWDVTLRRVTARGAKVMVIQPLWYERGAAVRPDAPGPSAEKVRDLYARWAAAHRDTVSLVDVAPLVSRVPALARLRH